MCNVPIDGFGYTSSIFNGSLQDYLPQEFRCTTFFATGCLTICEALMDGYIINLNTMSGRIFMNERTKIFLSLPLATFKDFFVCAIDFFQCCIL
jgi:hypothetical protein